MCLALWFAHQDRRQAEPLLRFVRRVAHAERLDDRRRSRERVWEGLRLSRNGDDPVGPVTTKMIEIALDGLAEGEFIILEAAPERYVQVMARGGGYRVERRLGDRTRHARAVVRSTPGESVEIVGFDDALATLTASASDGRYPARLTWEGMTLSG